MTHQFDPAFAPYFARTDLPAFETGASKVRFKSYHINVDFSNTVVLDRVNADVRAYTGETDFNATWASVITWENIKPDSSGDFGGVRISFFIGNFEIEEGTDVNLDV